MTIVSSTEIQNNFGKYLQMSVTSDIIITKNSKEVARLIGADKAVDFLSDSLIGVLNNDIDSKTATSERLKKYDASVN